MHKARFAHGRQRCRAFAALRLWAA